MSTTLANGNENAAPAAPERNVVDRVGALPLVQDAYRLVQSNSYTSMAAAKLEQLSTTLLHLTEPVQARLPLAQANDLANSALDFVEKRVPINTVGTAEVVQMARGPADQAASIAKAYSESLQSRLSPVTEQLQLRLQQGSELVASLPRDKTAATEAVQSLFRELESLSAYVATQRKALPAHAQAAVQPILDRLQEAFAHIKDEASKPDVALSVKTTEIISYSRTQLSPLLNDAVGIIKTVLAAASTTAEQTKDAAVDDGHAVVQDVQAAVIGAEKEASKKTKRAKAAVNGAK